MEAGAGLQERALPCSAMRRLFVMKRSDSAAIGMLGPRDPRLGCYHVQARSGAAPVLSWALLARHRRASRRRPARCLGRIRRQLRLHYAISLIGLPLGTASVVGHRRTLILPARGQRQADGTRRRDRQFEGRRDRDRQPRRRTASTPRPSRPRRPTPITFSRSAWPWRAAPPRRSRSRRPTSRGRTASP